MKQKVLVVHGHEDTRPVWAGLLKGYGCTVRTARMGAGAVCAAHEFAPDAILWDAREEIAQCLPLIQTIAWVQWVPIILLIDGARTEFAAPLGAIPFLTLLRTPCTARDVIAAVRTACEMPARLRV